MLTLTFLVQGAFATESLEVQKVGVVDSHFVAVARDCQRIYSSPSSFKVDTEKSNVLYLKEVFELGAADRVMPKILLTLRLVPIETELSIQSKANIEQWALAGSDCKSMPSEIAPYPTFLKSLAGPSMASRQLRFVEASWNVDGSISASFEAFPLETSAEDILKRIRAHALMNAQITTYKIEPEVRAKFSISHDAMAAFVKHHYTEQVCRWYERCWFSFWGVKLGCEKVHRCQDTPKIQQVFKDMTLKSQAVLDVYAAPGVTELKLNDAIENLFSKFLVSNFAETSRKTIGDITEVTLGQFSKGYKDTYTDEISTIRVVDNKVRLDLVIKDFDQAVEKDLRAIFESSEMQCLKAFLKTGKPLKSDNSCFN